MTRSYRWFARSGFAALAMLCASTAWGQIVPVQNQSFEEGDGTPSHWTLSGGEGSLREVEGASGKRAVTVTGNGDDTNFWRSETLPLEPSSLYRLRFRGRSLGAKDGVGMSGPAFCNRDLGSLRDEAWKDYTSFFMTPKVITPDNAWVRFGQWHKKGAIAFDDIEIVRAAAVHSSVGGVTLGDGESVAGNRYEFVAPLTTSISNYCRPVASIGCGFNTNRWVFDKTCELVFKHAIEGRSQREANVAVSVSECKSGVLAVDASTDGATWREIGTAAKDGRAAFVLPADIAGPAVWVRLRCAGGSFQVGGYEYNATVDGAAFDARGLTRFVVVRSADPRFSTTVESLGESAPDAGLAFTAAVNNTTGKALKLPYAFVGKRGGVEAPVAAGKVTVNAGPGIVKLPYVMPGFGPSDMKLTLGDAPGYVAEWTVSMPVLYASNYGERLPGSSRAVGLWWASSGWKISQSRPVPDAKSKAASLRMARNETEALQLVLRPSRELKGLSASASALRGPKGATIPAENVEILRERYVSVARPTDPSTGPGLWPDPLPPFREPITVKADTNQPLWVRVHAPKDAAAGLYTGKVSITAEGYKVEAPVSVEVYGFELPDRPTCVSAFGFNPTEVSTYHQLKDPAQQREVVDKYLASFAAHRISPYNPAPFDAFKADWPKVTDPAQLKPVIEWTAWDKAMARAFDEFHFTSFQLPSFGLGGGTFYSRVEPEILGFKEGTPEYSAAFTNYYRAVQEHLRERGWLDKAYVYWFDEPDPKDYDFVMNGFRKLKEAAPDVARMLTEQVEPGLIGGPNLWCPISDQYAHDAAEQQRAKGDKFWWYICCGPKAPYVGEFIDHAGTELRVWLWQTWQRKIDGILIWATNYWNSPEAYPGRLQDPYVDPMSWQTSYGLAPGTLVPWGNGDGRFLYPPEAASTGKQDGPVLEGPVDSIRWEMLRDGVEDYEYMVILSRLLKEKGSALSAEERARFEALLAVPKEITADATTFTSDPAPIEARRDAVARAIEVLGAGAK